VSDLTAKQIAEAVDAIVGLKAILASATDDHVSLTLTAKHCEALTGIKAATFLYWAWKDSQSGDDAPKLGPPSFKCGRRRLWMREKFLDWLTQR
jgi:hypothetical protein